MYLTRTDEQFHYEHSKEASNLRTRYLELSGKDWPPFNYDQEEFFYLSDWFAALKAAVERLEQG